MIVLGMNLGPHADFIVASYGVALAVTVFLIAWVGIDYLVQRRRVSALESEGITRRSMQAPRPSA